MERRMKGKKITSNIFHLTSSIKRIFPVYTRSLSSSLTTPLLWAITPTQQSSRQMAYGSRLSTPRYLPCTKAFWPVSPLNVTHLKRVLF